MSHDPDREAVLAAYADGLDAVGRAGRRVGDWDAPTPCGTWTALEVSGHVLAIIRYYLRLLDAMEDGRPMTHLPRGEDLAAMNSKDLAQLPEGGGAERVERFGELGSEHLRRLRDSEWGRTVGTWSGLGNMTVGEHAGVAVGEWHVHAWDLARASGGDHRPADAITVKQGQRVVLRATGPGDPWAAVLLGYGRDPHWAPTG